MTIRDNRRDFAQTESGRGGITLIEVRVVIAILGLLVSLLLPAVLGVREAARLTSCENNFKQLATGLQNFEDAHRALPPSYLVKIRNVPDIKQGAFGWCALILPMVDQGALYKELQPNTASFPTEPTRLTTTSLEIFVCPSDTGEIINVLRGGHAKVNYVAPDSLYVPFGVEGRSAIVPVGTIPNRPIRFVEITDGTSNTILLGERRLDPLATSLDGPSGAIWVGKIIGNWNDTQAYGSRFADDGSLINGLFYNAFSSSHSGGVVFAFADGHVKFQSKDINKVILCDLITRDGHETVTDN